MTDSLDPDKLQRFKIKGNLPSPKGIALTIVTLAQRDDVSIVDMERVIKTDPAFAGRIIKAANSAKAGARRPIASIHDAMLLLGIPALRAMALGFSLLAEHRDGACTGFDYQRFWSGSLARAIAAQALAAHTRATAPDECFSIGLLARIGELALATLFPSEYAQLLREGGSLMDREREVFEVASDELTSLMLLDWGLPHMLAEPVLHIDHPERSGFAEGSRPHVLLWTFVLATRIAEVCLAPEGDRRSLMTPLILTGGKLSIDADTLLGICDRVAAEWVDWGTLLNVETVTLPPFEELSQPPQPPKIIFGGSAIQKDDGYRMKILVVDDDPIVRAMLKTMLGKFGHEVVQAENGRQGLEMVFELRPQIVITDWMMPEMDGIELTRALRQTKLGQGIYVLILTALEDDEHLVQAFEAGVDDFMSKPVKSRVLAARLRAGQRVVRLQEEIGRDQGEIRRFSSDLAAANRRFSESDALLPVGNRRAAFQVLEREWIESAEKPLACLLIDIDGFTRINDEEGYEAGDQVLAKAVQAMAERLRPGDMLARVGSDEFLLICPGTTGSEAAPIGRQLCQAVVHAGDGGRKFTVSIGVASRTPGMAGVDGLLARARQALEGARRGGGNMIVAAD